MDIKVKSFPSSNGESFFIKLQGDVTTNILIDCGYVSTTEFIIEELKEIKKNNQKLDLIILTHIDNDHINGARDVLKYLLEKKIDVGEVWYNDYLKILEGDYLEEDIPKDAEEFISSLSQVEYKNDSTIPVKEKIGHNSAVCVAEYLTKDELYNKWNKTFDRGSIYVGEDNLRTIKINDVAVTVLGPRKSILDDIFKEWQDYLLDYINGEVKVKNIKVAKAFEKYFVAIRSVCKKVEKSKCSLDSISDMVEYCDYDTDIVNRSSIAVVIEFKGKRLLFLGDSSPIDMEEQMERYIKNNCNNFKLVKISHHGSKNNLSKEMIKMMNCEKYLVSTNGKKFKHPDVETISKIIFLGNSNKKIHFNYKPEKVIDTLKVLGKNVSSYIEYKNEKINDKDILEIDL
ncbi:MBL fold metallo-hydrolase [Clostridium sp. OS1-26]|uniref:MBL fold metallo-hydrolase n=1 Tax=Clostridium sp. OS1-26 TaxID=3070681 RepID=UPI0027E0BC58|nr:MBL fold metallo-hydrolase [Clostridium sp. OS1-26]WML34386.1 MBL fold metallo-hydrolase [Clostridium sp. OS1-26]